MHYVWLYTVCVCTFVSAVNLENKYSNFQINKPVNSLLKHILQAMVAQGNSDAVNTSVKSVNLISLFHQLIGVLTSRDSMLTHLSSSLICTDTHTCTACTLFVFTLSVYSVCVCVCAFHFACVYHVLCIVCEV